MSFGLKDLDINDYLKKLPDILQEARVVPEMDEDGSVRGFRFAYINKGSVFLDLGFEKGDLIKEVDGEKVEDAEGALRLFDELKHSRGFKMLVERDGKDVYHEFNVEEDAPIE